MIRSPFAKNNVLVIFISLLFFGYVGRVDAQQTIHLKPLGQVIIPYNQSFKDTPVGGLSGLTYDTDDSLFYVISDDRSENADARFYSLQVKLNSSGKLSKEGIQFENVSFLKTPAGSSYAKGGIDPEGIAMGSDHFMYVSSEGVPGKNIAPFINGYNSDGTFARALTIPDAFWGKNHKRHGVRNNLGFEGLSVSPDAATLYGATENALLQDGPAADSAHGSPARIIMYDLPSGNIVAEYRYDVEPIYITSKRIKGFAVNGLSDLLAIDNQGHLLTLERSFVLGQGNHICLYEISTQEATDIKGVDNLQTYGRPVKPVHKKLIADLSTYGIAIDNFEGLAFGPKLPGGGRLLLMVSDNNFSPLQQTLFTVFSFKRE